MLSNSLPPFYKITQWIPKSILALKGHLAILQNIIDCYSLGRGIAIDYRVKKYKLPCLCLDYMEGKIFFSLTFKLVLIDKFTKT